MILPGTTIGVLGGGQLGRMFCEAARTLGYRTVVLDPDPRSPAGHVADVHIEADYTDQKALQKMGERCTAVTVEFENVPADAMSHLDRFCRVRPSPDALQICRDRIREKNFLRDHDLPTAPFVTVVSREQLEEAVDTIGVPALLKTATGGYDGKGQQLVTEPAQIGIAFAELGQVPCVLERYLDLSLELSVVLARSEEGVVHCYPTAENRHKGGILDTSIAPARVTDELNRQAAELATLVANHLRFIGVLAVEFFLVEGRLMINEIAPRPHNSGHYTLNATVTSQFEQQVRMLCGLPAGETALLSPVVMNNLLGDLWDAGPPPWEKLLRYPEARLHLYGKHEARPGRKMGHFNVLHPDVERALYISHEIKKKLNETQR